MPRFFTKAKGCYNFIKRYFRLKPLRINYGDMLTKRFSFKFIIWQTKKNCDMLEKSKLFEKYIFMFNKSP